MNSVGDVEPDRRDVLRWTLGAGLAAGLGLVGVTACGAPEGTTTSASTSTADPLSAPEPVRTPTPGAPVERVVSLSSADLDVLVALGVDPVAAFAVDGTGSRPWRNRPAPPEPEWAGPGLPSLRSLMPWAADAFALAAADPTEEQLRDFEQLAAVIADPGGRPGWREHLELVSEAVDRDHVPAADAAERELEKWSREQRRRGVTKIVVVVGAGARPDTPVATLDKRAPLAREIIALGFDVVSHAEPVAYRKLRSRGALVVRVDPRDADVVAAVRQPSVSSLPWVLAKLVRGRRPG